MTLPAIINKSQEMVLKNQFKKVYSTMANAMQRAYADNGAAYYDCFYADDRGGDCVERDPETNKCTKYENIHGFSNHTECSQLFEAMKPILKVVKVCEKNALANGCVPADMKGNDKVTMDNNPDISEDDAISENSACTNFNDTNIKNRNAAWVLADGTVIGLYTGMPYKIFWVDINGHKKPNKWGHDIFTFLLTGTAKKVKLTPQGASACMPVEKGGKTAAEMFKNLYN